MPRHPREIPWLEQDPNGRYYVKWYDPERRRSERLSLRTRSPVEAQGRYASFLSDGYALTRKSLSLSVAEALDQYLREHVGVDPETRSAVPGARGVSDPYRQWVSAKHLKAWFGKTAVKDVDILSSRRYRDHRAKCIPPAGGSTVRRELTVLVAAANHAVAWKRLPPDQVPQVELPPHAPVEETKFYTKAELRRIFAELDKLADPRPKAFALLAYATGARRKSIERLRKSQIDLDALRLRLTPEGKRTTRKRAPIVPITPAMAVEVQKLLSWSGDSEWLFRDPGYDVYRAFAAAAEAAGCGDRTGPHTLRHSRATHMLQDGAALWDVAKLLGDTVDTIERVYGHHCPDYLSGRRSFTDLSGVLG